MAQPAGNMSRFEELVQGQLAAIAARLEELTHRMEEEGRAPLRPEDVPGQAELRTALYNLIEHLELAEGRTTEAIGHLRERLEEVAARTQEALKMAENCAGESDPAGVRALQARIDALNERLEDIRAAAESSSRAYVDACIGELAGKVEKVQELSARLPEHIGEIVGEQAVSAAESRVRQAEERMAAMVERLQNKLEDLAAGAMDVDRLRSDLEQVDGQLKVVREELAQKAGADELEQVRDALQKLSSQVETKADRDEVRGLQERLDALAAQLEALHAAGAPADDPRVAQLEEQVLSIRGLVEEALGEPLSALDERLGAQERRLENFARDMGRVKHLEEAIARLQQALENGAAAAPDGEADAPQDIAALKAGLAEVENFARESDRKTRDMLKAVHETLAEVVERLIVLEEGRRKDAAPADAAPASVPAEKAVAEGDAVREAAHAIPADDLLAEAAPQQSREQGGFDAAEIASVIAGLEPSAQAATAPVSETPAPTDATTGSGAPQQGHTPYPLADQQPQQEQAPQEQPLFPPADAVKPQQGPLFPPVDAGQPQQFPQAEPAMAQHAAPEPEQDFIAAARRAAMAAGGSVATDEGRERSGGLLARLLGKSGAAEKPADPAADATPGAPGANAGGEGGMQGLLSGLKRRFTGQGGAAAPSGEAATERKGGSRARLVLAGLVLLSAAALIVNRFGPFDGSTPTAAPVVDQQKTRKAPAAIDGAPVDGVKKKETERTGERRRQSSLAEPAAMSRTAFDDTGMTAVPGASERAASMIHTSSIAALGAGASAAKAAADNTATAVLPEELGTPALRKAALSGNGKAAFLVGIHFLKGQGVPKDAKAAADWFERAAGKGVVVAMYRLGALHEQGQGVPRDLERAKTWYERAAQRGNVRAMHNLGVLLASGKAGAPDYGKAAYWFRKAAEHGVRDSQFNLAVLYHRGQGVPRDLTEAWFWYATAARQGDAMAAEQERKLKPYVEKRRLASLQERLKGFRPKPPIRNANVVVIDRPEWRGAKTRVKTASQPRGAHLKPLTGKKLVAEVQRLLKKMGYDIGAVDGIMGDRTANAIRLFQLQSRMQVNGRPSMEVLERLRAATQGI